MFLKNPQIRRFTYHPKYYKPNEDQEEDESPRIKFRRYRLSRVPKKRSMLLMLALLIILIYLLSYWFQVEKNYPEQEFKFEVVDPQQVK